MEEREATLDDVYRWFREEIAASFAFLEDEHGCRRSVTRDEGPDGIFTRFRNTTTAVEVGYEPQEDTIELFLIKLEEGGRVPSYADAWQRNWVPLDRYLDHIGESGAEGSDTTPWADREALRGVLARHAQAMREHAEDVLLGDFSTFDDAKPPPIDEHLLYDVGTPADPWVTEDDLHRARSLPVQVAAWIARRLGRLVRRD